MPPVVKAPHASSRFNHHLHHPTRDRAQYGEGGLFWREKMEEAAACSSRSGQKGRRERLLFWVERTQRHRSHFGSRCTRSEPRSEPGVRPQRGP